MRYKKTYEFLYLCTLFRNLQGLVVKFLLTGLPTKDKTVWHLKLFDFDILRFTLQS